MNTTTNYGLKKPSLTNSALITDLDDNFDIIDTALLNVCETASGTATAITLTNVKLVNGCPKNFICSLNNGGSATTINGKPLYKPSTTNAPNLIAGKAYTVWYNSVSSCFFIKASAEGNTIASHVLAGDVFSNDTDTGLVGTMPNNGALSSALNCGASFTIPLGYTSGGTITANSLASQTIASATANQILYGITAWVNGTKITGTMPNNGTLNSTIGSASGTYTIPSGYTTGGTITAPSLATVTNSSNVTDASQIVSGYSAYSKGNLYNGSATIASLGGKYYASGSVGSSSSSISLVGTTGGITRSPLYTVSVSGLGFTPSIIHIVRIDANPGRDGCIYNADLANYCVTTYGNNSSNFGGTTFSLGFDFGNGTNSSKINVSGGSFVLPVPSASIAYIWYAIG